MSAPKTLILRHRKENLKKCSLRGLEQRSDMDFLSYPEASLPDLDRYIMLDFAGPPLTREDASSGLFLIDATWRKAEVMKRFVERHGSLEKRSLPSNLVTAYPRRQEDCEEPDRGLASVEALFIALAILGRDVEGVLDHYHWRKDFLLKNGNLIDTLTGDLPLHSSFQTL